MKKIEMKPGKTIFKAGEPADGLYIVGSGEVGIYFPTNKEMANKLIVSPNTIKRHLTAIFNKLQVHTRSAATAKAISAGIHNDNLV